MFQKTYLSPNPTIGQKGTKFTTDDANSITGELGNVVTGLGGTLDATKNNQVLSVLTAHFAPINSPSLTGTPSTTVPPAGDNSTRIPTTSWVLGVVTAGTKGVYVSQGTGTNQGTNLIAIGEDQTLNWPTIQVDNGPPAAFTLQQNDANTYGIKRIGWNKTDGCWVQDTNNDGYFLVDQDSLTSKLSGYLPISGGNVTGPLTNLDAQGIGFEYGANDPAGLAYIDFHTVRNGKGDYSQSTDYDARLAFSGGTAGVNQGATCLLQAASASLPATTIRSTLTTQGASSFDSGKITTDGSGNLTVNGTSNFTGNITVEGSVISNGIVNAVNGLEGGGALSSVSIPQGFAVGWNTQNGSGFTDFINLRGGGAGGFYWYNSTTTAWGSASDKSTYQLMTLNAAGNLSVNTTTTTSSVIDNGTNYTTLFFKNSGKTRWSLGKDNGSETGSNAGGSLFVNRYDDSGTAIDTPFAISRSTGTVLISKGITIPTVATSDNSLNAASTAYVKNNLASYAALGSAPQFSGVGLVNGKTGASIYPSANTANINFSTTDSNGTIHTNVMNTDGSMAFGGNASVAGNLSVSGTTTLAGKINATGELAIDNITNGGSGTLNLISNVSVAATISAPNIVMSGQTVATQPWVEANAVGTVSTKSGSGDLNISAFNWSQAIGNRPYIVHSNSDGSTSSPVAMAMYSDLPTYGWIGSNGGTVGTAGYVGECRWFIIGNMQQISFTMYLSTTNNVGTITFPKSFSGTPTSVQITNADTGDMDLWTNCTKWTSSTAVVGTPTGKANGMLAVTVIGPA